MPKSLPKDAKSLWEKVYDSSKKQGDDEETAARKAWGALKNAGWSKDDNDKWHKKAELTEFALTIKSAAFHKGSQEMRWKADASDVDADSYNDSMTPELFRDFISRIENNEQSPEEFRTEFWAGGMPYLSISHYPDLNGDGVPGQVDAVYVDGKFLKARGRYNDTPLGRACFKSICDDLYAQEKRSDLPDKVRISIAFLDWMHKHKSNGYIFERSELDEVCPECLLEMITGKYAGKYYLKGQLVHLAHTRVPVNKRTIMEVDKAMTTRKEDAASIIGDELADELEEKAKLVGKSEVLVVKMEKDKKDDDETLEKEAADKEEEQEDEAEDDPNLKKKSDAVIEPSSTEPDIFVVLENLGNKIIEISDLLKTKPEVIEVHPLDEVILPLKAKYDEILKSNMSVDDKLRDIQDVYNALGEKVILGIKSTVQKSDVVQVISSESGDIADIVTKAIAPIAQKLDLVATQVQALQEKTVAQKNDVPARRSVQITGDLVAKMNSGSQATKKSETPNLRAIIENTTR